MVPDDLKYSEEHEWVRVEGDVASVGITHFAQDQLGDIVEVELPKRGASVRRMKECGVVESVKTASDIFSPVSGEVVDANQALLRLVDGKKNTDFHPDQVNQDPYGKGWLFKVKLSDKGELDKLLSAEQYKALVSVSMPYIPHTSDDRTEMLRTIGVGSLDQLFADIPEAARYKGALDVPPSMAEGDLTALLRSLSNQNVPVTQHPCLLGAGAYDHFSPALVDSLLQRAEFYSAYTPYQPEASQGSLQAIYEFQSIISLLTGMEVANASLYEGGSAAAEAVLMALHVTGRSRILLSKGVHPHYRQVVQAYLRRIDQVTVEEIDLVDGCTDVARLQARLDDDVAAVVIQNPNFLGRVENGIELSRVTHQAEALLQVAVTDLLAMGLVKPPGAYDADVCFGEAQGLGLPLSFGGPYVGFISMQGRYVKRMPGRLAGRTVDGAGRPGFCLTLQAREQHIRRDKAVSNICTNQALCALAATLYVSALGRQGIEEVARACHAKAHYLAQQLQSVPGLTLAFSDRPWFHEWAVRTARGAAWLIDTVQKAGFVPPLSLEGEYPELAGCVLFCVTETVHRAALDQVVAALRATADTVVGARN